MAIRQRFRVFFAVEIEHILYFCISGLLT